MKVSLRQAQCDLNRLLERALAGEEIIIVKAGKPLARLPRVELKKPVLGTASGSVRFKVGRDEPLTQEEVAIIFGVNDGNGVD